MIFNRKIVGSAMCNCVRTRLVDAGDPAADLIYLSDGGLQMHHSIAMP
jgi:hypothetical protein